MESFNINDMKNLFGTTSVNGLPGVKGYENHKINWLSIGLSFLLGFGFYWLLFANATKGNKITVVKKKNFTPENKSEDIIGGGIQNHFEKYGSEIVNADEFDSTQ